MPVTHLEEIFRTLGLHQGRGAQILRQLYYKERPLDSLSENEIEDVEDDWSSRHYVSIEHVDSCNSIRPLSIKGESEKDFSLRHIEAMVHLLHTLEN